MTEKRTAGGIRIRAILYRILPCRQYQNEAEKDEKIITARLVPIAVLTSRWKRRVRVGTKKKPPPRPMTAATMPMPSAIMPATIYSNTGILRYTNPDRI